jgi:uncharacterized membrane protein
MGSFFSHDARLFSLYSAKDQKTLEVLKPTFYGEVMRISPHKSYNPSSWGQRVFIAALAALATLISLYLGLYQWKVIPSVWDPLFGNGSMQVLTSPLSHEITRLIRIPDAMLGVFAYFSDMIFSLAGSKERWQDRPWLVFIFGVNVIPLGAVSILLVIAQGTIVKYWCFLCLMAALVSLSLIFLSLSEVSACLSFLREVKKRSNWKTLWWVFWGYCTPVAIEAGEELRNKWRDPHVG